MCAYSMQYIFLFVVFCLTLMTFQFCVCVLSGVSVNLHWLDGDAFLNWKQKSVTVNRKLTVRRRLHFSDFKVKTLLSLIFVACVGALLTDLLYHSCWLNSPFQSALSQPHYLSDIFLKISFTLMGFFLQVSFFILPSDACCQMSWRISYMSLNETEYVTRHCATLFPNISYKLLGLKYPLHTNVAVSTENWVANDWNFMFWLSCFFMEDCTNTATVPEVSDWLRS